MIKRSISTAFMLCILVIASVFAVNTVNAETRENFSYNIMEDGTANITECFEKKDEVLIPTRLGGKKVSTISVGAFDECTKLETIKIPETVSYIDEGTFEKQENLTIHCVQNSYAHKFAEENNIKSEMLVNKIVIKTKTLLLSTGSSKALSTSVSPSNAYNKGKKWVSSNKNIATVNSKGVVTAKRRGTVKIYAKSIDGSMKQSECRVTVKQPVNKIQISRKSLTLNNGTKKGLKARLLPSNANNKKVKWSSRNNRVARVTSNGTVLAKHKGKTLIVASSTDGSKKTAKCTVTVKQPVKKVNIKNNSLNITIGKTKKLSTAVYPTNANNKGLTYKSSNKKVCTVDKNGVVRTISTGKATVYAYSKENKKIVDKCKVTVKPVINLSPYEKDLLARSLYREAGSTSYTCQLYVCSATINLWQSEFSHMSLAQMLTNYNIFETAYTLNSVSEWEKNSVMGVVEDVMNGGKVPNVKYFRTCYYHGFGTPVINIDNVYFSM